MTVYADSSFVATLYLPEVHTGAALRLIADQPPVWLTPLHLAEFTHAIEHRIFAGLLRPSAAGAAYADFERDQASGLWLTGEVSAAAFALCAELARRYAARLNPRTLDSLHVACALDLGASAFWTFDGRQAELARAVGLAVAGPE